MPSLGETLRTAREARGVTLDQAADATKIRRRYLMALERDDLGSLPGGSYRRVFVRTYAAYLGLDPDAALGLVPAAPSPAPTTIERPAGLVRPPRAVATWLIAGASFLGLAGIIALLQFRQSGADGAQPAIAAVSLTTPAATAVPTAAPEASPTPAAVPGAPGALQVQAKATESVWLAVEADDHDVFAGTLPKGESRTWEAATHIWIRAADGSKLAVTVNAQDKGALGKAGEVVEAEWGLNAQGAVVQQVTAATPQPARTPPPRSTPAPSR